MHCDEKGADGVGSDVHLSIWRVKFVKILCERLEVQSMFLRSCRWCVFRLIVLCALFLHVGGFDPIFLKYCSKVLVEDSCGLIL